MKQSRWAFGAWLPALVLATVAFWIGCEQKGEMSPTSAGRRMLTLIDTLMVEPATVVPGGTAAIRARILNELNQPAVAEAVRFSVTRGLLAGASRGDTTVLSDSLGWARADWTAPMDTGAVMLRGELLSMSEERAAVVHVRTTSGGEGLLTLWADTDTLFADNGTSATLVRARLSNSANNPIAGAAVYFSTTIGAITSPVLTDSLTGTAIATLTSTTDAGDAQIIAVAGTARDTTRVTFIAPAAASRIEVSALSPQLAAGTDSTQINAYVYDLNDRPIADNTVVFFNTTAGTLRQLSAHTRDGVAVTMLRAAPTVTAATVSATTGGGIVGTCTVQTVPGLAQAILLAAAEDTLFADNGSQTEIAATVIDGYGNAVVPGTAVAFTAQGGTITPTAIVGPNGQATAAFRAGLMTGPGAITATCNGASASVAVYLRATIAASMNFTVNPLQMAANGTDHADLLAMVLDSAGRPVSDGTAVTFTSQLGILSGAASGKTSRDVSTGKRGTAWITDYDRKQQTASALHGPLPGGGGHITTSVFTTNTVGGYAAATLISVPIIGTDTIRAAVPGVQESRVVAYVAGSSSAIEVSPVSSELPADGRSMTDIVCTIRDSYGNPVAAGLPVAFAASMGQVSPEASVTNSEGTVTTVLTTSRQRGVSVISVTAGTATGYGEVRFATPDVASVSLIGNTPSLIANGISIMVLTARAVDVYGVPVYGVDVAWQPAAGPGTFAVGSTTTDSAGEATAGLLSVASLTDTSRDITAVLDGRQALLTVPMLGVTISASLSATSLPADGASTCEAHVLIRETTSGVAVSEAVVRLAASLGSIPQTAVTNSSGIATATYHSATQPGSVDITAFYGNTLTAGTGLSLGSTIGGVTLSAQHDTLRADGISVDSLTAHVVDAAGMPMGNVEVRFTTTVGNIPASRVTDAHGNARVAFSSSQTGIAQLTATSGTFTANYTLYLIPGLPNSISLSYFPSSVGVRGSGRNETLLITATVRDANNNPVLDGTSVVFNIAGSPGGGDFLSSTGAIPTINGQATVSYNSGIRSGSARVRAVSGSVSAVSTEILIYAGPPYMEDVDDGCTTSHMSLASAPCNLFGMDVVGDSVTLVALVGDRYNNPVTPGTAVYFTTSGGVITTGTGYTDANGFARVTLFSGNPLPTIARWQNTLLDPNLGTTIGCSPVPSQPGVAKVVATSAGVTANGDSVTVWATTNVTFDYSQPLLRLRAMTVNGDPNERDLYIGENALIRIAAYDADFWPLVAGSTISFSANHGVVYPDQITLGCPSDTSFTISFFNNLAVTDDDAASPVLITVDTRFGDSYVFTETFTLHAALPTP